MVASIYGADDKVSKTGDTMTGTLNLTADPPLAVPAGTAGTVLTSDADGNITLQPPSGGLPNPMTGAGDLIYGRADGAPARLPGNAAVTREWLISQGTGSAAQAPEWGALLPSDIPDQPGWFNVLNHGATGNGSTDDSAAIQALIDAAPAGSLIFFPPGTYEIGAAPLSLPSWLVYQGGGKESTVIQMKAAANLPCVAASAGWVTSSMTDSAYPLTIRDLTIDGNSAEQTGGAGHGLVLQTYRGIVEDCIVQNTLGDGIRLDYYGADGATAISNTAVENMIRGCQIRNVGGNGIDVNDPSFGTFTDSWIENCIVDNVGAADSAIWIGAGAGWHIIGNHVYGTIPADGIDVDRAYMTKVIGNYIESWGASATSDSYSAINLGIGENDGGNGSVVIGNVIRLAAAPGNASSWMNGIQAEATSGNQATVIIANNVIATLVTLATGPESNAIWLGNQNSSSVLHARVDGNLIEGVWPGGAIYAGTGEGTVIAWVNGKLTGSLGANAESPTSGTAFAAVAGMDVALNPGIYRVRGSFLVEAVATAATANFGWTFSGTAAAGSYVAWQPKGSAFAAPLISQTITTPTSAGVTTATSAIYRMDCDLLLIVSAAGTLQLQCACGTSGDAYNVLAGSSFTVEEQATASYL